MVASLLFLMFLAVLAAVARERRKRRAFAEDGPTFECRIRAAGRSPQGWRRLSRSWSRWVWARWSGEVLVIRRGPVFDRTVRLAAQVTPKGVYVLPLHEGRKCGRNPIAVRLRTADGAVIEVAAHAAARTELVGMYVAAAFSDLPRAPVRRPEN
ncbi:hypothetical protein GCM10010168_58000 [Actinoplanes ianthinogenes]|uniref:DUF2550 family protein n=1 Tax=Actinoplanes ianthinogenes TaxID=122358 RepID=A0ABM7M2R2_9ACTN|nr:hypothetical protein Aiant_64370 [Actinoplanes ianthinogenes]GGR32007.1 hypothetical protein GCM10010168_58000 [Actinoplanes ianthinogenes]